MDRVFLDANVLFSASYREDNGLLRLWDLTDAELISSAFATGEALRNLAIRPQIERLNRLMASVTIVSEPSPDCALPMGITLATKDVPILLSAIQAQATHLLTGDKRHFGPLFEQRINGVLIQRPNSFLASRGP